MDESSAPTRRGATPAPDSDAGWQRLRPQTLVDLVIEALVSAAAEGMILPGDRIVEADLARKLGVSRVPVREALRLLESQGVVVSEPYKGIRLTPVTPERIDQIIEVRVALETSAAVRAVRLGHNDAGATRRLEAAIADLKRTAKQGDLYGFAEADTGFHRILVELSGNAVLQSLWEQLARQMTIIFGLSAQQKAMADIIDEHRILLAAFRSGDPDAIGRAIEDHISVQTHAIDFATIIARRRSERAGPSERITPP